MFTCNFCKKGYSSKSTLSIHQKTTKKCLVLQGIGPKNSYKCTDCKYSTELKEKISLHLKNCKFKRNKQFEELENKNRELENKNRELENKNKELEKKNIELEDKNKNTEKELKEYKDKFFSLIAKPTIINNGTKNITNNTNNLVVVDWRPETIKEKVAIGFTKQHLDDGLRGVARFTNEHLIRDEKGNKNFICTDPARMMFKYKDAEGVIQKDMKATKLKNAIKGPIIEKSYRMATAESTRLFDIMSKANDDHPDIEAANIDLSSLADNFLQVKNIDNNVDIYAKELATLII